MIATIYHYTDPNSKDEVVSFVPTQVKLVNELNIVERLDGSLDGATFNFYSGYKYNYPPFTIIAINGKYYFFSSECNKIMSERHRYYHTATLIEPTKMLQGFILGSKGFKIVEGKDNYNTNYDRIHILVKLLREKYCPHYYSGSAFHSSGFRAKIGNTLVEISLDFSLRDILTNKREYQFGSGTTFFDAISEIMSTDGVLLKCTLEKTSTTGGHGTSAIRYTSFKLVISGIDLDSQTKNYQRIERINSIVTTQSVDDYCYSVETEMQEVVSLNHSQDWYGVAMSEEGYVKEDNAKLIIDSQIYKVNYMMVKTSKLMTTYIYRLPRAHTQLSVDHFGKNIFINVFNNYEIIGRTLFEYTFNAHGEKVTIGEYQLISDDHVDSWNNFITKREDFESHIFLYCTANYVYVILAKATFDSQGTPIIAYHDGYGKIGNVLDSKLFELLEPRERIFFCSYNHKGNTIENLYNDYSSFWDTGIAKSKYNILEAVGQFNVYEDIDKGEYLLPHFESVANEVFDGTYQAFDVEMINPLVFNEKNLLTAYFGLNYNSISSLMNIEKSKIEGKNELYNKGLARSYSNGSNNIDLVAMQKDMQREVDMLGNITYQVESYNDIPLGSFATDEHDYDLGYVICKQSIIRPTEIYTTYVYHIVESLHYIAQAIGVQTQYEATKLITENVVNRYIYYDIGNVSDMNSVLIGLDYNITTPYVAKLSQLKHCDILQGADNSIYFVASTDTNYAFTMARTTDKSVSKHDLILPLEILNDGDAVHDRISVRLIKFDDARPSQKELFYNGKTGVVESDYSGLELVNVKPISFYTKEREIYKDPSERLIFVFKGKLTS